MGVDQAPHVSGLFTPPKRCPQHTPVRHQASRRNNRYKDTEGRRSPSSLALRYRQETRNSGPEPTPHTLSFMARFIRTYPARENQTPEILLKSIENCIKRRMEFRNKCVIPCSKVIKRQEVHDEFILILQILRARLIVDLHKKKYTLSDSTKMQPPGRG